jgi:hypothetical protein
LYLHAGKLHWSLLEGFWSDAGTFVSLFNSSSYWAAKAAKATGTHHAADE